MELVLRILQLVWWVVIIDALLSWVQPSPHQMPRKLTAQLTDPLYRPFRAILSPEKTGGWDLSPLFVLVGLRILETMLRNAVL